MVTRFALDAITEWTSCLPSNSRKKGSPESVCLLFHSKRKCRTSYRTSDIEQVPINSSLILIRQKPMAVAHDGQRE